MNADRLNFTLQKLLESHKRYVERATEIYERSIDAQLSAFTQATEKAEAELIKQLEGLTADQPVTSRRGATPYGPATAPRREPLQPYAACRPTHSAR